MICSEPKLDQFKLIEEFNKRSFTVKHFKFICNNICNVI